MSIKLEMSVFSKCLGDRYRLASELSADVHLELLKVTNLQRSPDADEEVGASFSLIFRGPLDYVLSEQVYRLEHEKLGVFELCLAPVGMDESSLHYEAVFISS